LICNVKLLLPQHARLNNRGKSVINKAAGRFAVFILFAAVFGWMFEFFLKCLRAGGW
jgi:hypothetical protein